jgi:hypothetical protein
MTQWAKEWVESLSKPDASAGIPLCPFAQKAWDAGDVKIVSAEDLWSSVFEEVRNFGDHRVVMCVLEEPQQEYFELEAACMALNKWFAFSGADLWLLGYQKERTIVFVQRLSELDSASIALEKLGYYKHYEPEDYDRLIMQRRLLRKGTQQ